MRNMHDLDTDEEILRDIIGKVCQGLLPWRTSSARRNNIVLIGSKKYLGTEWPSNPGMPWGKYGYFYGAMLFTWAEICGYRSNLWIPDSVVKDLKVKLNLDRPVCLQRNYSGDNESIGPPANEANLRYVYNIDQVEDCEKALGLIFLPRNDNARKHSADRAKQVWGNFVSRSNMRIKQGDLFGYDSRQNEITVPPNVEMNADHEIVPTYHWFELWREVIHWWASRSSDIIGSVDYHRWGKQRFSFEDLIAELGATFLCANLGIGGEHLSSRPGSHERRQDYTLAWSQAMSRDGTHFLRTASKYAVEGMKYVLAR